MKRSDEAAVVEKAHRQPPLRRGLVREMIRRVAERFPELRDGGFVLARQENLETIHRHSSSPSAPGCSPRSSPSSRPASTRRHHVTEREWLEAALRRPQRRAHALVGGRAGARRLGVRRVHVGAQAEEVVGAADHGHRRPRRRRAGRPRAAPGHRRSAR